MGNTFGRGGAVHDGDLRQEKVPVMVNMVSRRESRMEWSTDVEVTGIRGEEKAAIAMLGTEN